MAAEGWLINLIFVDLTARLVRAGPPGAIAEMTEYNLGEGYVCRESKGEGSEAP